MIFESKRQIQCKIRLLTDSSDMNIHISQSGDQTIFIGGKAVNPTIIFDWNNNKNDIFYWSILWEKSIVWYLPRIDN